MCCPTRNMRNGSSHVQSEIKVCADKIFKMSDFVADILKYMYFKNQYTCLGDVHVYNSFGVWEPGLLFVYRPVQETHL